MHYTGPQDAVCPITLTPVDELRWPVALNGNTARPYECEALVEWVMRRPRDPMTNLRMTRIAIGPLEGLVSAAESTAAAVYLKRKFLRPCVGWKDLSMLLYTAYMAISVLYFSYIKPRVDETIQCFFWDATMDLALSNPACGIYLLAWCLSSGFVFWVYFTCHHKNLLRYKAYQLLFVKTVAQIIMCITGVSPQIPITVSCCAYVLCAVEYLNWRCCDPLYVVE